MESTNQQGVAADAESQFNANFIRKGSRRKCMFVQDKEEFVKNLHLFMQADKIK